METAGGSLCVDDCQSFRDVGDETDELRCGATESSGRFFYIKFLSVDGIQRFGDHQREIIVVFAAGDLLVSTTRLPQCGWNNFGRSHCTNSNGQQQSQPRDGDLPVLFLTAAFGGERNDASGPMCDLNRRFDFVAMLPTGAAVPRPTDITLQQQRVDRQRDWMVLINAKRILIVVRHPRILPCHETPWNPIDVNRAISIASRILMA